MNSRFPPKFVYGEPSTIFAFPRMPHLRRAMPLRFFAGRRISTAAAVFDLVPNIGASTSPGEPLTCFQSPPVFHLAMDRRHPLNAVSSAPLDSLASTSFTDPASAEDRFACSIE